MDINFELYKVFYHVAFSKSFSLAANRLCISQSAVSQSIKSLEEKLGCRIFLRSSKQVKLTPEGEILFKHVEQAFNYIKTGERSIEELYSLKAGVVRIGASDTICKYYLLPYLQEFNRLFPKIKIQITNRTSPRCLEMLKNSSLDVAIVNLPEKMPFDNIIAKKTKNIQDVFIAGKTFSFLKNKKISLKELDRYPLLMLEKNTVTRKFFDQFCKNKGVNVIPEIELGSVDLLVEMAQIGLGISFVPMDAIEKSRTEDEIFMLDLKEKIPSRSLGIVTNNSIPVPVGAQKFIDLLEKEILY
ncbi:MAG: LysR family transcriptional regulator [Clostridia bacterium]|nr:LysR family transcriptional regulator [Clostridia bacterium]